MKLRQTPLFFALLLACSSPAPTETHKSQAASPEPKEKPASIPITPGEIVSVEKAKDGPFPYEIATLSNGMRVITLEDHTAAVAAVHLWYHVGSKDERKDRRGFAHMFEHMMFRGTDRLGPEDHFNYIRQTGGDANAYTAFDQTVYVQEVPSNQVEMVLWLESERMAFLRVDEQGFEKERNVVAEEYRRGAEAPYGNVLEELLPLYFPDHPYAWSPIGDMEQLKAAGADELQTFWERYYIPNNATLVVVGDIEHKKVQEMALHYFGWIPRYPDPPTVKTPDLPASLPAIEIDAKNGPAAVVGLAFRGVPLGHKDKLALDLLGQILGGGESSRLYRELVVGQKLSVFSAGGNFSLEESGAFAAAAVLAPLGSDKDKALGALQKEVEKLRTEGPTERELLKAKNRALKAEISSQLTVAQKASRLGEAAVLEEDLEGLNGRLDEIRKITLSDLQKAAKTYLAPERATEIHLKPSLAGALLGSLLGGGKSPSPASQAESQPQKSGPTGKPGLSHPDFLPEKPPIAKEPPAQALPKAKEITLKNGLKVVFLEDHEVPLVTYFLGVRYGAYAEPSSAPGTASFAAGMLTRGTQNYDYLKLAEELETYAIDLAPSADFDTASVFVEAISDEAKRAMLLLAEVVRRPTFPKEQLDLLLSQAKTGKSIEAQDPSFLAERELKKRIFGKHPYARSVDGELADLETLNVAGLKKFWASFVRPDACVLYIVGDLSEEEAGALAKEAFGDWSVPGAAPEVKLPEPPERAPTHIYLIDKPGDQSQIRAGYRGITRDDPRYLKALVLNQVFGGGFNSRLNSAIRVEEGLTYGARGSFSSQRFLGRFVVSTFSKNETAARTVQLVIDEIKELKTSPPTEEEVFGAKTYLLGSYVLNRETPRSIAGDLWLIEYDSLSSDYFTRYLEEISKTTPDDLAKLTKELVDEENLVIVVVGPASTLQKDLEKIAPMTVLPASQ